MIEVEEEILETDQVEMMVRLELQEKPLRVRERDLDLRDALKDQSLRLEKILDRVKKLEEVIFPKVDLLKIARALLLKNDLLVKREGHLDLLQKEDSFLTKNQITELVFNGPIILLTDMHDAV